MTIQELYEQSVKPLSAPERFQLATMILNDIPPRDIIDYRDEWGREDLDDFTRHCLHRVESNPHPEFDG